MNYFKKLMAIAMLLTAAMQSQAMIRRAFTQFSTRTPMALRATKPATMPMRRIASSLPIRPIWAKSFAQKAAFGVLGSSLALASMKVAKAEEATVKNDKQNAANFVLKVNALETSLEKLHEQCNDCALYANRSLQASYISDLCRLNLTKAEEVIRALPNCDSPQDYKQKLQSCDQAFARISKQFSQCVKQSVEHRDPSLVNGLLTNCKASYDFSMETFRIFISKN